LTQSKSQLKHGKKKLALTKKLIYSTKAQHKAEVMTYQSTETNKQNKKSCWPTQASK